MPSIAIIVLDTVRKDAFDDHFDWLPGIHFDRAYSTSHWTVPAHASLYTGRYPSELGVHGKSPALDCREPVLAEQFREAGYRTRLLSANPNIVYHDGWERGFEEVKTSYDIAHLHNSVQENVLDWPHFIKSSKKSGLSVYIEGIKSCMSRDVSTIKSLRHGINLKRQGGISSLLEDDGAAVVDKYIRDQEFSESEFLFVNLMEAHNPYDPPVEYNTAGESVGAVFGEAISNEVENETQIRQGYDDAVRYLADVYRDIFEGLEQSFDYVITLSDHGECLGEHGMWNHGYGVYSELVHVPLVISGGGVDAPTGSDLRSDIVSLLDVHQTVADLAGISVDSRGTNVLETSRDEPAMTEYHGLLSWHYEQLCRYGVTDEEMDALEPPLNGVVDSEGRYGYETHDSGFVAQNEASEALQRELDRIRKEVEPISIDSDAEVESGDLPAEVEAQLRNLGYK